MLSDLGSEEEEEGEEKLANESKSNLVSKNSGKKKEEKAFYVFLTIMIKEGPKYKLRGFYHGAMRV